MKKTEAAASVASNVATAMRKDEFVSRTEAARVF